MSRVLLLLAGFTAVGVGAGVPPAGDGTRFDSANGVAEQCIQVARAPGAVYSAEDQAAEARLFTSKAG